MKAKEALGLTGSESANTIIGNAGKNLLDGRSGNDNLRGGLGKDSFVFDSKLSKSRNHLEEPEDDDLQGFLRHLTG